MSTYSESMSLFGWSILRVADVIRGNANIQQMVDVMKCMQTIDRQFGLKLIIHFMRTSACRSEVEHFMRLFKRCEFKKGKVCVCGIATVA